MCSSYLSQKDTNYAQENLVGVGHVFDEPLNFVYESPFASQQTYQSFAAHIDQTTSFLYIFLKDLISISFKALICTTCTCFLLSIFLLQNLSSSNVILARDICLSLGSTPFSGFKHCCDYSQHKAPIGTFNDFLTGMADSSVTSNGNLFLFSQIWSSPALCLLTEVCGRKKSLICFLRVCRHILMISFQFQIFCLNAPKESIWLNSEQLA